VFPLKFGTFVPTGTKGQLAEIEGPARQWDAIRATAHEAESLGYDSIWVADHLHTVPKATNESVFEAFTTLTALAEATSQIRLGTLVAVSAFRAPSLLAKMTATLDVISGGRLEVGLGCGWYKQEHAAYGIRFRPADDRVHALDEAIEIMRKMWTEPQVSFRGRFHTVVDARCFPKPLQVPHPPIWVGGGGERLMLRTAARVATRANFDLTKGPDDWAHKRDVLFEHCRSLGRDTRDIELTWNADVLIRDQPDEVAAAASRLLHDSPDSPRVRLWMDHNLVGTPQAVARKVRTYMDLGCTYFVLGATEPANRHLASLEQFAAQVIPNVR
jgi:F420-dependent oxidoreductase-like protein